MSRCWGNVVYILGLKAVDQDEQERFNDDLARLTELVRADYGDRTLEEVVLAYRMLIGGKLGIQAYRELNPASFGTVMKAYDDATGDAYRAALDKMNAEDGEAEEEKPELSEEEKEELFQQVLSNALMVFRNTGSYDDWGNCLYQELASRQMLILTPSQKWELMDQARASIVEECRKAQQDAQTANSRQDLSRKIDAILSGNPTGESRVKARAMRMAVNNYLRQANANENNDTGDTAGVERSERPETGKPQGVQETPGPLPVHRSLPDPAPASR